MSCTWEIQLSLDENQEKTNSKSVELHEYNMFFSYKKLLFGLGNYVWNEKWPSFIIPSLIWKLSIVTPFEPNKFPSISRPRITPTLGAKEKKDIL